MTKCEMAQKGVDRILTELEALCDDSFNKYYPGFDYS